MIEESVQQNVDEKIKASFKLMKESDKLLDCARVAVEKVIETDEDTAYRWLSGTISEMARNENC